MNTYARTTTPAPTTWKAEANDHRILLELEAMRRGIDLIYDAVTKDINQRKDDEFRRHMARMNFWMVAAGPLVMVAVWVVLLLTEGPG